MTCGQGVLYSKDMLTIQIVTWNSRGVLPETLAALKTVPPTKAIIRFIDNASEDGTVEYIRSIFPTAEIISLSQNHGFAGAHNLGFTHCATEFVLTCDPDLALVWEGIEELLEEFTDGTIGAVQGKLLRQEVSTEGARPIIDSAGIVRTLTLNGEERGAGEVDSGQYNATAIIDAVTGALGLYRVSALQAVAYEGKEIFDEDFFAYKEDVDLGWRLKRAGYECKYIPVVAGIHRRTLGKGSSHNWGTTPHRFYERLMNRRTHYSLRNYVWMLIKNMSFKDVIFHDFFITGRLAVFLLFTVIYPPLLATWVEILHGLPSMVRKRVAHRADSL